MALTILYANLYRFVWSRFAEKPIWAKVRFSAKKSTFRFTAVATTLDKDRKAKYLKALHGKGL